MPSHHVGWSILVGIAAVSIGRSKWRWIAVVHTALTMLAVTATANHWWLDGVVAGLVLAVAYALVVGVSWVKARAWPGVEAAIDEPVEVEPQLA
jgi:hypothetical protein